MVVIIPPCQEPCCRRARGEPPYAETPEEAGRRLGRVILEDIARRLADPDAPQPPAARKQPYAYNTSKEK